MKELYFLPHHVVYRHKVYRRVVYLENSRPLIAYVTGKDGILVSVSSDSLHDCARKTHFELQELKLVDPLPVEAFVVYQTPDGSPVRFLAAFRSESLASQYEGHPYQLASVSIT